MDQTSGSWPAQLRTAARAHRALARQYDELGFPGLGEHDFWAQIFDDLADIEDPRAAEAPQEPPAEQTTAEHAQDLHDAIVASAGVPRAMLAIDQAFPLRRQLAHLPYRACSACAGAGVHPATRAPCQECSGDGQGSIPRWAI